MKLEKSKGVRIVKREGYGSAPDRRITEDSSRRESLLNLKNTVLAWIHELENKRSLELQREFSNLFGAKGVAGENITSQAEPPNGQEKRNKLQGKQVPERE